MNDFKNTPTIHQHGLIQTDDPTQLRDINSKALLSNDQNELRMHRHRAHQMKNAQKATNEINNIQEQVDTLSNDMTEIKMLLQKLIGNS